MLERDAEDGEWCATSLSWNRAVSARKANNVKEDEKNYQKDFKKGLIGDLDEGKVSDQQADKVFQDYVTDGAKRDTITYKVREADANNATIEIVAKNVNIGDMDFDQLSSNFESVIC